MAKPIEKIGVLGAGSWGTSLSALLARKGCEVTVWAHEPEVVAEINADKRNSTFLPDIELPVTLTATHNLRGAVVGQSVIVSTVPAQVARSVYRQISAADLGVDAILVSCTKGIEVDSGKLMSEVIRESLPSLPAKRVVFLSGPTFAREVALGLPTAAVIAGIDAAVTQKIQKIFRTDTFLTYTHDDVVGVEVGGGVKNVIAIACGMGDGLGFGHNTRAALITRGLYEMIKIGKKLGANPLTFAGLTGVGDLVLTCTGELSRNRTVGFRLGKGESIDSILKEKASIVEGVATTKAVYHLVKRLKITAPISTAMYRILFEGKSPRAALKEMMAVELKEELRGIY